MNEKEDNEEVVFKVNDRRKFNPDGSLREGYESAPEMPKQTKAAAPAAEVAPETPGVGEAAMSDAETEMFDAETETTAPLGESETDEGDDDFPGADDPASFVNFLSTLATNAAAALGAMPHPATGQRSLDLETGRYWIDVLAMLQDKTKGNLHPKEEELFKGLVSDLRMQYVQISRMAEERLKQQAAQKFSANDILGKK